MSMDRIITEEARLVILRELRNQPNESATSTALRELLAEVFAIVRPREWVELQIGWLAEMGAVRVTDAGSIKIASLTEVGTEHLRHKRFLAGVKRTSLPVG